MSWTRFRTVCTACTTAGFAIASACGGGEKGSGPAPSLEVIVSSPALTVQQGASGSLTVSVTRGGGLSGNISLAVSGLPTGVTVAVSPDQLSGATTSASVLVTVAAAVPPGTYLATVKAAAARVGEVSTTYTLVVTAAPDFSLSVTTPAMSVLQGSTGTAALSIKRTNFSGAVTFSLASAPSGIGALFTPSSAAADSAVVTLSIAASVPPGTYSLTIAGSGAPGVRTVALGLTVTVNAGYVLAADSSSLTLPPGGGGSTRLSIARDRFAGPIIVTADPLPTGVAVQIVGSGDAQVVTVSAAATVAPGTYTVTLRGAAVGLSDRTIGLSVRVVARSYAIVATPLRLDIAQGDSALIGVQVVRTFFTAQPALAVESPQGVVGVLSAASPDVYALALAVEPNATLGERVLRVRGRAATYDDQLAEITITVVPAAAAVAVILDPAVLAVGQGEAATFGVTLGRTNYSGVVSLAATAPSGLTIAFSPPTTALATSTGTVSVGASVPTGTYSIPVTASGSGITTRSATLRVTVTSQSGGGAVDYQFCSPSETPVFFAYQDGASAWQRVFPTPLGTGARFAFSMTTPRGGIAYVVRRQTDPLEPAVAPRGRSRLALGRSLVARGAPRGRLREAVAQMRGVATTYATEVIYGTASELIALGLDNCAETPATKTVTATIAGISGGQEGRLSLGGIDVTATTASSFVTFQGVPTGPVDLLATRVNGTSAPDKLILRRNLNPQDGGGLPTVIDFSSAIASAPASGLVTIGGGTGDEFLLESNLTTSNGRTLRVATDFSGFTSTTRAWFGAAASAVLAGDVHGLSVFARPLNVLSADVRLVLQYVGAVGNVNVALGPPIAEPTSTLVAVGSYPRFRFQGALPTEYQRAVTIGLQSVNSINVTATGSFLTSVGSASAYDLTMPDLSALLGFPPDSRLGSGAAAATMSVFGWSGTGVISLRPRVGDTLRGAARDLVVNIP